MFRLLSTAALLGALIAAPALGQTMNPASPSATDRDVAPPADSGTAAAAGKADIDQNAPQTAKPRAPGEGSGSSARRAGHPGDHSADRLNRQELQQIQAQ